MLHAKIKVIIEIEESNKKPTQICGKFLTSALTHYLIHKSLNNEPMAMDENVIFIQIVNVSKLKNKTSKIEQWTSLEQSINSILPLKTSNITKYRLFFSNQVELMNFLESERIVKR